MNTHNDFLNNAVDDEYEMEGIESLIADVCSYMQNDTEKMCLSLRNGTCGDSCNAFTQKTDSVINVKEKFGKGKVLHDNITKRARSIKAERASYP